MKSHESYIVMAAFLRQTLRELDLVSSTSIDRSRKFLYKFVFLFVHVKLRSIIIIRGTNERCSACSNNRKWTISHPNSQKSYSE